MSEEAIPAGLRLNALLEEVGENPIDATLSGRLQDYLALLLHWSAKLNLTSIRDQEGILKRHFVESIFCARALPAGIRTLLDFGSGAGFPGIPVALCRPEIAVTLAESQGKKAAFLREAMRTLDFPATVYSQRAETLLNRFDCVTLRAVDRMPQAVVAAASLVSPSGHLALMTTFQELEALQAAAGSLFAWDQPAKLPWGEDRCFSIGRKTACAPAIADI
jgi:16S rRNA (guanine527-N7)-methyltransferase